MSAFIAMGECVQQIPRGVSYRDESGNTPLESPRWQMDNNKENRTYVPEVVDALEQRRAQKPAVKAAAPKPKKPRKKLIYDDFGEPLRWVWVDE